MFYSVGNGNLLPFNTVNFQQAMRKKARSLGMTHLLDQNAIAKKIVKMAMALPLLPQDRIDHGLQMIEIYAGQHNLVDSMARFFQYLRTTWIEGKYSNVKL